MDLTGDPDGEPQKTGVAFADIFSGLYAVIAIQAALARRAITGLGGYVDMALMDTQVERARQSGAEFSRLGQARRAGSATPIPISCPIRCFASPTAISSSPPATIGRRANSAAFSGSTGSPTIRAFASNAERVANRGGLHRAARRGLREFHRRIACSPRWRRLRCRPGRSIRSPRSSPTRRSWRALCASICQPPERRAEPFPRCARRSCSTAWRWRRRPARRVWANIPAKYLAECGMTEGEIEALCAGGIIGGA